MAVIPLKSEIPGGGGRPSSSNTSAASPPDGIPGQRYPLEAEIQDGVNPSVLGSQSGLTMRPPATTQPNYKPGADGSHTPATAVGFGPLGFRGRSASKAGADAAASPIKWGRAAASSLWYLGAPIRFRPL